MGHLITGKAMVVALGKIRIRWAEITDIILRCIINLDTNRCTVGKVVTTIPDIDRLVANMVTAMRLNIINNSPATITTTSMITILILVLIE